MTVDYNENAYLKERTIIKVSGILSGNRVRLVEVDEEVLSSPVFYISDATGMVDIDITDIVRIYGSGTSIELQVAEVNSSGTVIGQVVDIDIYINGGTDPKNWLVPLHAAAANWELVKRRPLPSKIVQNLADIPNVLPATKLETTPIIYRVVRFGGSTVGEVTDNNIALNRTTMISIQRRQTSIIWNTLYSLIIEEQECDKRYAAVQWIGRDGNIKRATWELRRATENTEGEVEIKSITNAYDIRKGSEITAVLHLGGLTAYDVWYYGDIVTSSDVRLALNASDYDTTNDTIVPEQKIAVTTKKIEIPDGDGGKFYDLDIEINYKRYDTV